MNKTGNIGNGALYQVEIYFKIKQTLFRFVKEQLQKTTNDGIMVSKFYTKLANIHVNPFVAMIVISDPLICLLQKGNKVNDNSLP